MNKLKLDIDPNNKTHISESLNSKGRPTKPADEKCTKQITVNLTKDQFDKIESWAKLRGGNSIAIKTVLADKGII